MPQPWLPFPPVELPSRICARRRASLHCAPSISRLQKSCVSLSWRETEVDSPACRRPPLSTVCGPERAYASRNCNSHERFLCLPSNRERLPPFPSFRGPPPLWPLPPFRPQRLSPLQPQVLRCMPRRPRPDESREQHPVAFPPTAPQCADPVPSRSCELPPPSSRPRPSSRCHIPKQSSNDQTHSCQTRKAVLVPSISTHRAASLTPPQSLTSP